MTYADLIAYVLDDGVAGLGPAEMDNLLWEHTPFPVGGAADVYRELAAHLVPGFLNHARPCRCPT